MRNEVLDSLTCGDANRGWHLAFVDVSVVTLPTIRLAQGSHLVVVYHDPQASAPTFVGLIIVSSSV